MAETPFPNPLTSQFNPSAWENNTPLTEDEINYLDNNFVTFPTAQPNVTFPVAPTVPTLAIATSDTRAASAQFVQNAKNTQTWGALQTFNAGMVTNAINPTTAGGTLLIGNASASNNVEIASASSRSTVLHLGDGNNSTGAIHIGNGTSSSNNISILNGTGSTGTITLGSATSTTTLGCPLTPNYAYSAAGAGVGKIGQIIDGTFTIGTTPIVADTPYTVGTMTSLPIGVWLIAGSVGRGGSGSYQAIGLNTTLATFVGAISQESMATGSNNAIVSMTSIIVNTTATTYYLIGQSSAAGTWASASFFFRAVRIA
jgi:hypothetical protein